MTKHNLYKSQCFHVAMMQRGDRHAALELSIGTVVIVVLGVTMLIMGLVVTRNIMCGAVGMTDDINSKVRAELNKLFAENEGEVTCIGAGDAVKMAPGKENNIYCAVKAPQQAQYAFTATRYDLQGVSADKLRQWLTTSSSEFPIAPNDRDAKKVLRIKVPENAPEGNLHLDIQVKKEAQLISTQNLDFEISRIGFIRSAAC